MKQFLQNLMFKFQRWMYGRYGGDELSRALSVASLVCLVLSWFLPFFYFIALALLVWSTVRICSRNISKRQHEREIYLRLVSRFRTKHRLVKRMWTDRKTHKFFKCKQCGAVIRIPKGKGDITVGCPKCRTQTVKHT